jgi:hypothetical protein
MKREIKFRAWDKIHLIMHDPLTINQYWAVRDLDNSMNNFDIMQYIGLKDKTRTKEFPEGKEIYEDDICKYNGVLCTVVFNNGAFMVRCGTIVNEFVYIWDAEQLEIIGNKHENSELL